MNTYKAFYRGKQIEVKADTTYEAQKTAAQIFKARKSWEVNIVRVAKDGAGVVHVADQ